MCNPVYFIITLLIILLFRIYNFHISFQRHQSNRINAGCSQNGMGADNYFTAPPFGSGSVSQAGAQQPTPRSLYPPVPPAQRGFPSWQPQQSLSHQESAAMAAVANAVGPQAATLWSSNYTPPPAHHHHPPYVGVIGADRPSSTSSVSMTSRFQSDNACASIYGSGSMRSGTGTTPGAGGAPFAQPPPPQAAPLPPPSGLYASSPTHPTPPPPLPFDPSVRLQLNDSTVNLFPSFHYSSLALYCS